jgi:hypothetical protein
MRWRSVSLTACSAALVVAGCGGGEDKLPERTAVRLSTLARQVVQGKNCGAPLLAATIAAVNRAEVPHSLQETLLSDANRVAATCSKAVARQLAERVSP